MTKKSEFNAEEWEQVLSAPPGAGLLVATAQRGGTFRETFSIAKAYTEARKQHGDSDLLGEIAATPPQLETREFKSAEELRDEGLARIRESVALVEVKATPDELEAYKNFNLAVAKRAAEATKSGGFLGIGGERVSESEKEALGQLAEALGLPAPTE